MQSKPMPETNSYSAAAYEQEVGMTQTAANSIFHRTLQCSAVSVFTLFHLCWVQGRVRLP